MRVGIDIDFAGNKNLTLSEDGPDVLGDNHLLGANVKRAVDLLDAVYINARASLWAHDKNPVHEPSTDATTIGYWSEEVERYRRFIIEHLGTSEEDTARGYQGMTLDQWLRHLLGQELGDREATLRSITHYREALAYLNELIPQLPNTRTTEDWKRVLFVAIKGDPTK